MANRNGMKRSSEGVSVPNRQNPESEMKPRMNNKLQKAIASSMGRSSLKSWLVPGLAASMMVSSQLASALGLGALDVQSNLDQPLNGLITVNVSSGDDIGSVKAAVATREEFESLGIDYPEYLKDLDLKLENSGGGTFIRVSSNGVVINEPFIHFLVRVEWSGGSFLREYTALIDPPVYAAEAPKALATPSAVGTDQSYSEPSEPIAAEDMADPNEVVAESLPEEESVDVEEPAVEESYDTDVATETAEDEPLVEDNFYDSDVESESSSDSVVDSNEARYGPIKSGESLSMIAQELQSQVPDLSVYSIMKVLFEENPDAFINNNINGLMEGAVLNLGDLDAIRATEAAAAKAFFREQVEQWNPGALASSSSDAGLSVGQDTYNSADTSSDFGDTSGSSASENFQVGASENTDTFVSASQGTSSEGEVIALREEIVQLQSSLASSELENQELTERISILEGQLADMNRLMDLNVEDADLATLESNLATADQAEETTEEVTEAAPAEESSSAIDEFLTDDASVEGAAEELLDGAEGELNDAADAVDDAVSDADAALDEFINDTAEEVGEELTDIEGDLDGAVDTLEGDVQDGLESVIEETTEAEPTPAPSTTTPQKSESFIDKITGGMGLKALGGLGALLLGGLGLFFWRRRQADEEFEISMLSIEGSSQTVDTATASGMSATMSASTASVMDNDDVADAAAAADKETSFLTVYSDSDAVVQADEVDPIAEADVYIAYGRDEQAEEVLLDGIASHPDRIDVKRKLLDLYHKTGNAEGFERVAEELYSQRDAMQGDEWQEISDLGKELNPDNPLWAVSGIEFATVEQVSENVGDDAKAEDGAEPSLDDQSELVADSLTEGDSVQLINFDDGRSETSQLDELEIDAITSGDDAAKDEKSDDDALDFSPSEVSASDDVVEIDLTEDADNDGESHSVGEVQEVSDLEISEDYDEARTQYELAKVFVDLGDQDGARKILDEIVADSSTSPDVLKDAQELLDSMNS